MGGECCEQPIGCRIVNSDISVESANSESGTVRVKGDPPGSAHRFIQSAEESTIPDVPKMYLTILGNGCQSSGIRTECHATYCLSVSSQLENESLALYVPKPNDVVISAEGKELPLLCQVEVFYDGNGAVATDFVVKPYHFCCLNYRLCLNFCYPNYSNRQDYRENDLFHCQILKLGTKRLIPTIGKIQTIKQEKILNGAVIAKL
jgi:hypothetical protein